TAGEGGRTERPVTAGAADQRTIATIRAGGRGIAASYPRDRGIEKHPAVLLALNFDDPKATAAWYGKQPGYAWTGRAANVYSGGGALEVRQVKGTHTPGEIHPTLPAGDVAFVRWYRKWDKGYDWTQHKMSGVYAWAGRPRGGGAGRRPNGRDKFSCKLYVDFARRPRFYTYHPEQRGGCGDGLGPNLVREVPRMRTGRWYCFEMMIKANDAPKRDGELKMWLDGRLIGHYRGMRFRDTNELKINQFTYSAYVGGTWVSRRDQRLWDDQIVVAREYIGPMSRPATRPAQPSTRSPWR
ncbi:MAG: polysaccharide lyase, partial [Planctomycetota bacterium]